MGREYTILYFEFNSSKALRFNLLDDCMHTLSIIIGILHSKPDFENSRNQRKFSQYSSPIVFCMGICISKLQLQVYCIAYSILSIAETRDCSELLQEN